MDKKTEIFRQYMLCGHGRCFSLIAEDRELYRETVLYGCLNDISYDMQCEGSRGQFMYMWFLSCAEEQFGKRKLRDHLRRMAEDSREIRLFRQ